MKIPANVSLPLVLALALALAGCGDQPQVITNPAELTPLSEDQKAAMKSEDQKVAEEEHANPVKPTRGGKASR